MHTFVLYCSQLENYAKWHLVQQYFNYLGSGVNKNLHSFTAITKSLNIVELAASSTRYVRCIMDLQTLVPYTLSLLYTEHVLPSGTKEQIQDMASKIKTAFIQRLESNTWIDQPTRQASINKASLKLSITRCIHSTASYVIHHTPYFGG